MSIIDLRLRPPYKGFLECQIFGELSYYPTRMGFPRPPSADQYSVEELIVEMDQADIRLGVIPGRSGSSMGDVSNDDIAEFVNDNPNRFIWLAGLDIESPKNALVEMDRVKDLPGLCGFAIEPAIAQTPRQVDDAVIEPIYERCLELDLPISISLSALMGPDLSFASPIAIGRIAKRFPGLNIVVAHGAWPFVSEVLGIAFACPNIYVSPDLYMTTHRMPHAMEYINAAKLYLGDRLLFGSGYPSRPLVESVESFDEWALDNGLRDAILAKNAERLFKLTAST